MDRKGKVCIDCGKLVSFYSTRCCSCASRHCWSDPVYADKMRMKLKRALNTPETRLKLCEAHRGRNNGMWGKRHSEETKRKIAEKRARYFGVNHWAYGKRGSWCGRNHLEETKRKISNTLKGRIASEHFRDCLCPFCKAKRRELIGVANLNWRGGISFEPYGMEFNKELKALVKERDGYRCQICGKYESKTPYVVHHVDYDKRNNQLENLVTLCGVCHGRTNGNREYWKDYFERPLSIEGAVSSLREEEIAGVN